MKSLKELTKINARFVFTDIDDTLTNDGLLSPNAFLALWQLQKNNIKVVPVTGRPAGWCELIARQWPVAGVIGENGGFYFRYFKKKMKRYFINSESERIINRERLNKIADEVLSKVPGSAIASDQFCRMMDLAIDYCEDVPPLNSFAVQKIVDVFVAAGAHAKVSSIHVNGWFGNYDKLSMVKTFCVQELGFKLEDSLSSVVFVGDSPNDEPMFNFFKYSFGVANIRKFSDSMKSLPSYISDAEGGEGFAEIAKIFCY